MANGVNVKMNVSGIGQFKKNINEAKNSLKTLDAQLALNEKQFKATGDSEAYMQQKSELLEKKLEEQKRMAAEAENALKQMADQGVNKTAKAYQDMQQQLLRVKGDMIDTETALQNIGVAGEEAGNGVDAMNAQLKRIGDGVSYQNVMDGLSSITSGIEGVIKKAWQMGEMLVKSTLGAGAWADELATTAAQYEITPEDLQRYRKTAQLIDTDAETILDAQDKLKKGRESQNKQAMGALAYLGIDPSGKSDVDVFWEAGEAIAALGKEEDKVSYAQALFGKSWRELMPLFNTGREEYEKTFKSWNVVEQKQLDALGKMDDQYQKMSAEWETFKMEMLSAFSGPLTEGMETITGLFEELNNYLDTPEGQAMLKQMGETISGLITDLTAIDPAEVVGGLKSVIDGITDALKWIGEHKGDVVDAMKTILAGWAGLKLTGGVLQVMELVKGLQFIKSNPNITIPGTTPASTPAGTGAGAGTGTAATAAAAGKSSWLTSAGAKIAGGSVAFLTTLFGDLFRPSDPHRGEVIIGEDGEKYDDSGNLLDDLEPIILEVTEEQKAALETAEAQEALLKAQKEAEDARRRVEEEAGKIPATEEQRKAAEAFWDAWREDNAIASPESLDKLFEAEEALIEAYAGQREIYEDLNARLWELHDKNPRTWTGIEDIPEDIWQAENYEELKKAADKMGEYAESMTQESDQQVRSSTEMTTAATTLQGMPSQVEQAIIRGMSQIKIYIDGTVAGRTLANTVGMSMGDIIASLIK